MKTVFVLAVFLAALNVGCVSRSRARADAEKAFLQGQHQASQQQLKEQIPYVTILGDVRQRYLPWTEELSLGRALLAAEYRGLTTPHEIVLTRKGEWVRIETRKLLQGSIEDPLLEPGDVIEIRR